MKINISYTSISHFNLSSVHWWVFMFKRYTYINGFIIRIFGVYINVREKDATDKLLKIAKQQTQ